MDRRLLIAAGLVAALSLSAAPTQAQQAAGLSHSARSHRVFVEGSSRDLNRCGGSDRRHDGRHGRDRFDCRGSGGFVYADGEWALYNNRSWAPDSYNDWWNDRPDRAYPRWVQEQQARGTCDPDRMWWSGSGWHC